MSSFVKHGDFIFLDRFSIYNTSKGEVYITDSDGLKLSCKDIKTEEDASINLEEIYIKNIHYKNQGILYKINPIKKYKTSDKKDVVVKRFNRNILECIDIKSDEELNISINNIVFEESEKTKIKPFLTYEGEKIDIRPSQRIISTGLEVEVISYDKNLSKAKCSNGELYDPFKDFYGFQNYADNYVKNKKTFEYFPKVYFQKSDDNSEKIPALISNEFKSTSAVINGSKQKGVITGNNQNYSQLILNCDNGDKVFVNLDELENSEEIKKKALEFYEKKQSKINKDSSRSNEIDYVGSSISNKINISSSSSTSSSSSKSINDNSNFVSSSNQLNYYQADYNLNIARIDRDIQKKKSEILDLSVKRMEVPINKNTDLEIAKIDRDISYLNYEIFELAIKRIQIVN